jgi:hypothetical protein
MIGRTDLSAKMIALANKGHPRAKELRDKADAFDRANNGIFQDPPTHTRAQLMGCLGGARRLFELCGGTLAEETLGECARIRLHAHGMRR